MMIPRRLFPLVTLSIAAALAGCASEDSAPGAITLTDGLGRQVTLQAAAQRVVSLAPSNTELLFEVGAGAQAVGRDVFSDYPAAAAALPSVGGSGSVYDAQAIVALKPDLVLAAGINTREQVESLASLGLNVFYLSNPSDLAGLFLNLQLVGALTGKSEPTEALIATLWARVEAVIDKLPLITTHYRVYYELDAPDPARPFTAGPGSYIHTLLERAGDQNIAGSLGSPFTSITSAEVIAQNPDFILLGDSDYGVTVESVRQRAGWSAIGAVQNGRVVVFDNDIVSRPTARIVDAVERLAKLFHPEVFP